MLRIRIPCFSHAVTSVSIHHSYVMAVFVLTSKQVYATCRSFSQMPETRSTWNISLVIKSGNAIQLVMAFKYATKKLCMPITLTLFTHPTKNPVRTSAYLVSKSTCDVLLLASSACEHWLVCFSCISFTLDSSSVNFALNHSIVRLSTVSWPGNSFPDVSSTRLLSNVKGTGEAGVVLQHKTVLITSGKNAPEFQTMILLQF